MKIVLFSYSALPTIGGMEMVIHHLARSLQQLGQEVRVVSAGGFLSTRNIRYVYPVHRWPALRDPVPVLERLTHLLLDTAIWGCDVLHAHDTYLAGYAGTCFKRLRNVPLVVTPHGEDINIIPEIGYGARLDPCLRPKIIRTLEGADILTSISASVEASLLDAGARREKIRNIPNGVDSGRFQRIARPDIRNRFKIPEDSRIILTVGNHRLCKGHEVLVRAMPIVIRQEPRAHLVIVGRNNEVLQPLVEELKLERKVTLTGSIDMPVMSGNGLCSAKDQRDDLADIYCSSSVYVSAGISEGAEGLSLAMLDGMAAGLPIVATGISGNRDIICDGKSGFLVPPSDPQSMAEAIIRVFGDPDLGKSMGAGAGQLVSQYEWTQVARRYVAVYEEALELSKRR